MSIATPGSRLITAIGGYYLRALVHGPQHRAVRFRRSRSSILPASEAGGYAYSRLSPIDRSDCSGLCSEPADIPDGGVGICFEAFIAAKTLGGIGEGDGRAHTGTDPLADGFAYEDL